MIEIKDKNYSELDKDESFTEYCELVVKTTDENGNTTEEEKEGIQIKGKDMLYLNAPEIYFPENAPLDTEKRELYEILNELFQDGGEGGDWQPPPWWIPVPEPEPYELYFLVWVTKANELFSLSLVNNETASGGGGALSCDWGDGTTIDIPAGVWWGGTISHKFTETGQYLIKITTTDELNCFRSIGGSSYVELQIVKTGSNISFFIDGVDEYGYQYATPFNNRTHLKYIKVNNTRGLPFYKHSYYFGQTYSLVKIELATKMSSTIIPEQCFNLSGFRDTKHISLDTSAITTVGKNAFSQCKDLRKIFLPNCTYIGDNAFNGCCNLQEIVVAEGCTFGTNCFQSCYSLYPRPDGSTN